MGLTKSGLRVERRADFVALEPQHLGKRLDNCFVVVDDEKLGGHGY
jgi:hypothetical protein